MPTKETLALTITNIRACLLAYAFVPRSWVQELLTAYENVKNEADAWRRTYNQVSDAYRGLLASKPEVYLVDGHDAAYWALRHHLVNDGAAAIANKWVALSTRHEALSSEYLALQKQSWENEYKDMYASYAALNREYSDLRVKYDRLQRVATECEDELREIRQINS